MVAGALLWKISIHALCEEGDLDLVWQLYHRTEISIHALCEEGDEPNRKGVSTMKTFLSTPSARRATHPPRRSSRYKPISIHALCEEGDMMSMFSASRLPRFLSTPSARRATRQPEGWIYSDKDFYPRPLRVGRPVLFVEKSLFHEISIHALCEEGDIFTSSMTSTPSIFLSTPSARRATDVPVIFHRIGRISIHALCEEGDPPTAVEMSSRCSISIHALCEEGDLQYPKLDDPELIFLSTPSARRATTR